MPPSIHTQITLTGRCWKCNGGSFRIDSDGEKSCVMCGAPEKKPEVATTDEQPDAGDWQKPPDLGPLYCTHEFDADTRRCIHCQTPAPASSPISPAPAPTSPSIPIPYSRADNKRQWVLNHKDILKSALSGPMLQGEIVARFGIPRGSIGRVKELLGIGTYNRVVTPENVHSTRQGVPLNQKVAPVVVNEPPPVFNNEPPPSPPPNPESTVPSEEPAFLQELLEVLIDRESDLTQELASAKAEVAAVRLTIGLLKEHEKTVKEAMK